MRRKAQLLFAKSSHFELISVLGCASTVNSVIQAVERRAKRNAATREIGETLLENFIAVFEIGIMNSPRLFIWRLI
jgi:NADH:ubiquinone oxidoreductase subunit 6 (subunit J)